jgi:ABC-2 type transport system ATP-binding protein
MSREVLCLKGISKQFEENQVLRSIDFSVAEGTIMGLVGKNGAGKTTMIKCLLGLIKPDEGDALIFDEPSWNLSVKSKHRIGYVPQATTALLWMRVEQMLKYTSAFYSHWNWQKVDDLINEWELDRYAKISTLSEGERQKLAIIRAMAHEPEVFIFDEPVASLDPLARRKFIKQLIDMNINENKTVLFSTHITSDLERVAADVALLKDGKINFEGDLSTLKDRILRLRIQSRHDLPQPLPIPNIISSSGNETTAVITVDGLKENEIPQLEKQLSAVIAVEHLNLEEIFLELNK